MHPLSMTNEKENYNFYFSINKSKNKAFKFRLNYEITPLIFFTPKNISDATPININAVVRQKQKSHL